MVLTPYSDARPTNRKLRLGLLIDSLEVEAWVFRCLEKLLAAQIADLAVLILNADAPRQGRDERLPWAYRLYNRADAALFGLAPSAFEKKSLRLLLPEVRLMSVRPEYREPGCEIAPADVAWIKGEDLDLLLNFGFDGLGGQIAAAARGGVWAYAWGQGGVPAGYWEALYGLPETAAAVVRVCKPDERQVLARAWHFTYPFSAARNCNALYWEASSLLPRLVSRLQRQGQAAFFASLPDEAAPAEMKPAPAGRQIVRMAARIGREAYRRTATRPTWYLRFGLQAAPLSGELQNAIAGFTSLRPPKDRFWADPHVVFENHTYYVFVEEYLYAARKGHISVIEIRPDGSYRPPERVLETDYHLSYPFVFNWQGQYYLIPESAHHHTIDLYECVEFPRRWKFCLSLMENVRAVDTTLFYHQDRWWLFTALSEEGRAVMPSELHLFSAPHFLTRDWTPHPHNPVVADIKKARPAGRIFQRQGKIYRPSQYSHGVYGYGFDLNEVLTLSPDDYAERRVCAVRPTWEDAVYGAARGTHTFAQVGDLTMIDAFTYRSRLQ